MQSRQIIKVLVCVVGLTQAGMSIAQTCNKDFIVETAPTARFSVNEAIALDYATGFEWSRCPLGHVFDDNGTEDDITDDECTPEGATRTKWTGGSYSATARIDQVNADGMAGHDGEIHYDWRIPNIKELSTLIERACIDPARNIDIFPVTVANEIWSSTLTRPWSGEWYSTVYTLSNSGDIWGTQVDTDPLDWGMSGYDNDSDPSKWLRVYAVRSRD